MDIFISWSRERSKKIADILTDWLPQVIQAAEPWMSKNIEKGARWSPEISERLARSKIGIICLTPENLHEDWILFEAGALSKIKDSNTCTFLIDLNPADIEQPLAQFQHTVFSKDDVKKLLVTINQQIEHPLQEKTLSSVFEKYWPELEEKIRSIPPPKSKSRKNEKFERPDRDLLEEILELSRRQTTELALRRDIGDRTLRGQLELAAELHDMGIDKRIGYLVSKGKESKDKINFKNKMKEKYLTFIEKEMPKDEALNRIKNEFLNSNIQWSYDEYVKFLESIKD
jgi:hypothetical protein